MMLNPQQVSLLTTQADSVNYLEVGSGTQSVVLLHGLFGTPSNWCAVMEELAACYRFYALQLPIEYHENRRHKSFHGVSQLTQYVESFFNEVELDRAVVVGNSLGGQIALDLCLRNPARVEGLVLAGSAGLYERSLANDQGIRLCRRVIREQAGQIFHDPVHVTDQLVEDVYSMLQDRQYRRFLLKVAKATRDRYLLDDLPQVDVPALIVWGRNDLVTPPFVAEQFRDAMPHAELVFIEDCGHSPPIEQPHEFARLLHAFLQQRVRL